MRLRQVAALAFADEMDKIAGDLDLPLNFISAEDADFLLAQSFLGDMLKEGANRAVKEWRKADAAGDTGTADAIAKGYAGAGLKPRYLKDVSLGGAEAGVDRMMGDVRHSTGDMPAAPDPVAPRRALDGRLDQMKANKEQLGLEGRSPTSSVKQSPEGRAALLRGTQPAAPSVGPAPNENGYIARKMYKPDSYISQAEFTPKLLEQKKQITDTARALSPEAKNMMPAMYGHTTSGTGPTQRSMSYHEFVPGMKDLRGKNTGTEDKPIWSQRAQGAQGLNQIQESVLKPMEAKGLNLADVTGERGTNWGNVARGGDGHAKVVDFLPNIKGQANPASQSFAKYAPMPVMRHSAEGGGSLGDLRKEMYKPTMESRPAAPGQALIAMQAHQAAAGQTPPPAPVAPAASPQKPYSVAPDPFKAPSAAQSAPTASPVSAVARTAPTPGMAQRPTSIAPPSHAAPAPAIPGPARVPSMQPAATAAATPRARPAPATPPAATPTPAQSAPTAAPGIKPIGASPVGAPARVPPHPMPHPTAMSRPMLPTRPVLGGLHR